jgi:hypothetical protein
MRKTIAQNRIEQMQARGYRYLGMTSGQPTIRKGSNLYTKLIHLGLTLDNVAIDPTESGVSNAPVVVRYGAHRQRGTEGWELLIFAEAHL